MKATNILLSVAISVLLSSCNYLDIVPEERNTPEDTYKNPGAARGFLYSCYSKLPNSRKPEHIDKYSAGEVCFPMEKNDFQIFPRGYYSPNSLSITKSYYDDIWVGIRRCYEFLDVVDLTPNILEENLKYYKAEATFLIGYYHFLALRAYGPIPIIRNSLDYTADASTYPERSSVEEVVEFIDQKIEEALPNMAESFVGEEYGRFTRYAALALRSRLHLYAASPLFNGNNGNSSFYADFKSKQDGRYLIAQTESKEKWLTAEKATREAIEELENNGFRLYNSSDAGEPSAAKPGPVEASQRAVRYAFMDNKEGINPEVIMVDTRPETQYEIQNQSCPRQSGNNAYKNAYNSCAPTLQIVEMFYTKNGLPIDEDLEFDYNGRYDIVDMPNNYDGNNYKDPKGKTLQLHLNREPRFYAWIGFHNGFFEITKYNGANVSNNNSKKAIQLKLMCGEAQGAKEDANDANYSGTGYLNKKFFHPAFQTLNATVKYPYPIIRMAELYLNYAEILIELGGEDNLTKAKVYIDKVRERAGVDKIDVAWAKAKHPEKANTQEGLREIVRHERQIEFYLENHRFWDLRRWKKAEILGEKVKAMNIYGKTEEDFFQVTDVNVIRTFKEAQYLMPIPQSEINKCPQWVQNPGY